MFAKVIASTALVASLVAPLAANAGEVENRVHHEQARINAGLRNDTLTPHEYARLDRGLDRVQAQRNRDLRRNDGRLTAGEAVRLNREENRLSGAIYRTKHDGPGR